MLKGIDCATKLSQQNCADLAAAGYRFAGRYLVPNSGSTAWKALTRQEAQWISDAGMDILAVWELSADRVRGGLDAGTSDGAKAYKLAKELGIPTSAAIYFAVDYDAKPADYDTIEDYLRTARDVIWPYRIGVYGSCAVVTEMDRRGIVDCVWQCMAWSYGALYPQYSVYQHTAQTTVCKCAVDINDCTDRDKAGLWNYKEDEIDMTKEDVLALIDARIEAKLAGADSAVSDWAKAELAQAVAAGITDGSRPQGLVTREQAAIMALRATR